jgi:putative DNA primase/helicase
VFVGNHKPVLRNVDDAARRRFNIIPFTHTPENPDKELKDKLRAEYPAILRWMIDGCLDWQKNGLVRPPVVTEATAEYFSEQDSVRQWIDECCETGDRNVSDTTEHLFASWTAWAMAHGEKPGTSKWLHPILQRQGYEPVAETPGHRKKRGFVRISVKVVDTSGQYQNRSEADDDPSF